MMSGSPIQLLKQAGTPKTRNKKSRPVKPSNILAKTWLATPPQRGIMRKATLFIQHP
jgi:hypothetical protein